MENITLDTITHAVINHGDPHLDSDTTFAVRSAIVQLQKYEAPDELKANNQSKPFYTSEFDFMLKPVTPAEDHKPAAKHYVYSID